jgi:hypothetical protein
VLTVTYVVVIFSIIVPRPDDRTMIRWRYALKTASKSVAPDSVAAE